MSLLSEILDTAARGTPIPGGWRLWGWLNMAGASVTTAMAGQGVDPGPLWCLSVTALDFVAGWVCFAIAKRRRGNEP